PLAYEQQQQMRMISSQVVPESVKAVVKNPDYAHLDVPREVRRSITRSCTQAKAARKITYQFEPPRARVRRQGFKKAPGVQHPKGTAVPDANRYTLATEKLDPKVPNPN